MRKINIDGQIYPFDMSDGRGEMRFSMDGAGRFKLSIDHKCDGSYHYIQKLPNCFDGKLKYTIKQDTTFGPKNYIIDDDILNEYIPSIVKQPRSLKENDIIVDEEKLLYSLEYNGVHRIFDGYYYGLEIETLLGYSIQWDGENFHFFSSFHNSYLSDSFCESAKMDKEMYKKIRKRIKILINDYVKIVDNCDIDCIDDGSLIPILTQEKEKLDVNIFRKD